MSYKKNASSAGSAPSVVVPYISASKILPEVTIKSVVLGILLSMTLAASNAYLGLKVGQTVTACIPAAVISMAILRFFKRSNILENNMVQTIASAGEALAGGVIFTLPALILMGYWTYFPFMETISIAIIGGLMGILMSVPLRRALIVEKPLPFPEGVATAEVLKAGDNSSAGAKDMMWAGLGAGVIKLFQSGFQVLGESAQYFTQVGTSIFGFGTGLAPVLMGAGYIVGIQIGLCLLGGALVIWGIGIPIYSGFFGIPEGASSLYEGAMMIWSQKLRYIGVGGMVVGGLSAIVSLMKPIASAVRSSLNALNHSSLEEAPLIPRTEKDIPMSYVLIASMALILPVFILFSYLIGANNLPISSRLFWVVITFSTVFAFFIGFLCSAIGGYMAGIVGSSSNPLSGITLGAILAVSLSLLAILGSQVDFSIHYDAALSAAATAIIIGAVVACASTMSCDNLQDLKTGQIVGATPWKQQVLLMVGVIAGALVITPVLQLLYEAYGIGTSLPRANMDPTQVLSAPQATVMAAVAKGVFFRNLEWSYVIIGALISLMVVLLNKILRCMKSDWSFPVLAVASGLYLPYSVTVTAFIGSLISYFALRTLGRAQSAKKLSSAEVSGCERRGLLFASGTIAGEALVGIFLAIPFAIQQSTSVFKIDLGLGEDGLMFLGTIVVGLFCYMFYKVGTTPLRVK